MAATSQELIRGSRPSSAAASYSAVKDQLVSLSLEIEVCPGLDGTFSTADSRRASQPARSAEVSLVYVAPLQPYHSSMLL